MGAGAALDLTGRLSGAEGAVRGNLVQSLPSRVLGRTGEQVPILGLGTSLLGKRLAADEAMNLLQAAVDRGVTYIGAAPANGGYGHAQAYIGEALRERRSEIFLVTKWYEAEGDAARRLLEASLLELQTDAVDLGMGSVDELEENVERVRRYQPLSEEERTALAGVGRELARAWGAHFAPVS